MTKIFISYRREDSSLEAEFLRDRLRRRIKGVEVFYDLDSISVGRDFKVQIDRFVAATDFFLALIGRSWLTVTDATGRRRLDDPDDFVRLEIESALNRNIPTTPVLLGNVPLPAAAELPECLRGLAACRPHAVRLPPDFKKDVDELVRQLRVKVRKQRERMGSGEPPVGAAADGTAIPAAAMPADGAPGNGAELAERFPTAVEIVWPNHKTYAVIGQPLVIAWRAAPGFGARIEGFQMELLRGDEPAIAIENAAGPLTGDCRSLFWNVPKQLPRGDDYRVRIIAHDSRGQQRESLSDRFAMPARRRDIFPAVAGTIVAALLIGAVGALVSQQFWPLLLGVSLGVPLSAASMLMVVYPPARRIIPATIGATIVAIGILTFFTIRTRTDVVQYLITSTLLGTIFGALIAGSQWKLGERLSLTEFPPANKAR